ncbi:MAG: phosphodiester glycosidase family protein [Clostridia bacterium]
MNKEKNTFSNSELIALSHELKNTPRKANQSNSYKDMSYTNAANNRNRNEDETDFYANDSEYQTPEKQHEKKKEKGRSRKANKNNKKQKRNGKKKKHSFLFRFFRFIFICAILGIIFLFLFFKTSLFQKYKELWVQTAMSTMNHQWLATMFLSQEEIDEIMGNLEVQNNENSNSSDIHISPFHFGENVTYEEISGKGYKGHVILVKDPSKVEIIDTRKKTTGTKLGEIVKSNNAVAGINAGGFKDEGGHGKGNVLAKSMIIDKTLYNGNKSTRYQFIGMSKEGKLILGKYTYQEAMRAGINSAVEFGPYLIVNGKNQIKNSNSGGIQPRTAIGQKKDGTIIMVCIDGRKPGYSLGATLMDLQNVFNKYGAHNAANLDGGSSSTMYYNGKLVNKPSTPIGERYLPNAIIVKK